MPTATQAKPRKASARRKAAKVFTAQDRFLARIDNAGLVATSKQTGMHRSRWTPEQDRLVLAADRLGLAEVARQTHRSYNAVASRRSSLLRKQQQKIN